MVDRPDHARGSRKAARKRLCAADPTNSRRPEAFPAPVERVPLSLLRLDGDRAREHLRPDTVPVAPLLQELPATVRAIQDDLTKGADRCASDVEYDAFSRYEVTPTLKLGYFPVSSIT